LLALCATFCCQTLTSHDFGLFLEAV
jgi:hypothetical protein